jgi:hypothetical protein
MTDDAVGYGKPPKTFRFKPGTSGNPKGRPKRKPFATAEVIKNTLGATIQYREQGRVKTTTRTELGLRMVVERAVKGDLAAADLILKIRAHAQRDGDIGVETFEIGDWLPDYRQQTAEQKTTDVTADRPAETPGWWQSPSPDSAKERDQ